MDGQAEVELLLQLIKGEVKLVDACREHDLKQSDVEAWRETFVAAGERGLKARSEDEQAAHEREVRYGLEHEYITPYSPEQNGMIERFFLTLKQECVWLQRFDDRDHAFRVIADWLDRYHSERPHSALGYLTPKEFSERRAA